MQCRANMSRGHKERCNHVRAREPGFSTDRPYLQAGKFCAQPRRSFGNANSRRMSAEADKPLEMRRYENRARKSFAFPESVCGRISRKNALRRTCRRIFRKYAFQRTYPPPRTFFVSLHFQRTCAAERRTCRPEGMAGLSKRRVRERGHGCTVPCVRDSC